MMGRDPRPPPVPHAARALILVVRRRQERRQRARKGGLPRPRRARQQKMKPAERGHREQARPGVDREQFAHRFEVDLLVVIAARTVREFEQRIVDVVEEARQQARQPEPAQVRDFLQQR